MGIVVSLLFLVLFGTIQFGIAFNRMQGLHAAAREGARVGSLPTATVNEIVGKVKGAVSIIDEAVIASPCPATLTNAHGCVDVSPTGSGTFKPCDLRSGLDVTVTVKYRDVISIPFFGQKNYTMQGAGKFRCE
jgi:Flp pilus assembly protein TadG